MMKMDYLMSKCIVLSALVFGLFATGCASKKAVAYDQKMIDELVQEHRQEISRCYESALQENPQLPAGRIELRADHLPDGRLVRVRSLKSFPGAGPVIQCMSDIIGTWQTKRPMARGPVDISWTFERAT